MAPAWVDICRPSATSANEPNRPPPTISTPIITPHSAITPQILRSFCAWPVPRKTWLWPFGKATPATVFTAASLFEVAVDDIQELFTGLDIGRRAGKMG